MSPLMGLWNRSRGFGANAGGGSGGNNAGGPPEDALDPESSAAAGCALEIAARQIARQVVRHLSPVLEQRGLLAVVTASPVGAAVLAAARQLGTLQFPVSGIVLGSLEYTGSVLGDEIRRCRAFKIPLRECQNERDLQFVLQFSGLRLIAVDLHEEVTRHSELRDTLLDRPCVDIWRLREPATDPDRPWIEQVGVEASGGGRPPQALTADLTTRAAAADWDETQRPAAKDGDAPISADLPMSGGEADTSAGFQPLLTVADLPPPSAPSAITPGQQVLEQWAPLNQFISPGPVSRETARLLDSRAIKDFHLTGLRMMELAAFQAAEIAAVMARPRMQSPDDRVAVICGRGNNGGDGFVLARYLASWGFPVEIYILGEREKILEDALINLRRAERLSELLRATHDRPPVQADALQAAPLGLLMTPGWCPAGPTERFQPLAGLVPAIELVELTTEEHLAQNAEVLAQAALIVDGMLGTGMVGDVRGLNRAAIGWVNAARTARSGRGESAAPIPVLALDTPSGIDASTGAVLGEAVQADVTVTFGAPKIAFTESAPHPEGRRYAGDVFLVEIGWPPVKVRAW